MKIDKLELLKKIYGTVIIPKAVFQEAEVLILANEQNADLVILDEIMGRRYAKQLDINLTGTVGILLKAKEKGLVKSIRAFVAFYLYFLLLKMLILYLSFKPQML